MQDILLQMAIYLAVAVVAVPISQRLGFGSVLGYLAAGLLIGPVMGLVGSETEDLQHFAEYGMVLMLFLIRLEMKPKALWDMRSRLLGLGGLQAGVTLAAIMLDAVAPGLSWNQALAVGIVLCLSSTAIVMQTLNEKKLARTEGGRAAFAVLLFQDLAVIPLLALVPLLALDAAPALADPHAAAGPTGGVKALLVLGVVAASILGGRFLTRPLHRSIAMARLPEIRTAAALLLVVAISAALGTLNLSPALGSFLAGVVLANSEYRHELESDIAPFKGLLMGLFFIIVGAGIDLGLLASDGARRRDRRARRRDHRGQGSVRADCEPDAHRARAQDRGARRRSRHMDRIRAFGIEGFYGDVDRPELLAAAGIAEAKTLVLALDDPEKVVRMARYVSRRHPQVRIIARARDRHHVYQLYAAGARERARDLRQRGARRQVRLRRARPR